MIGGQFSEQLAPYLPDFPYKPTEQCMALSYHLHTVSTQVPGVPEPMLYATAVVLLGFVLVFNSVAVALRVYMRNRKRW